jgi:hypothetical protein
VLSTAYAAELTTVAETECGRVRGARPRAYTRSAGIPYGGPTEGAGRFLPPSLLYARTYRSRYNDQLTARLEVGTARFELVALDQNRRVRVVRANQAAQGDELQRDHLVELGGPTYG